MPQHNPNPICEQELSHDTSNSGPLYAVNHHVYVIVDIEHHRPAQTNKKTSTSIP